MAVDEGDEARLAEILAVMRPALDERQWRRLLGAEARARGHGGIRLVARAAGVSATTVAAGAREIEAEQAGGAGALPVGRARRPGGGRKRAEENDPGLRDALLGLVEASARGDPRSRRCGGRRTACRARPGPSRGPSMRTGMPSSPASTP